MLDIRAGAMRRHPALLWTWGWLPSVIPQKLPPGLCCTEVRRRANQGQSPGWKRFLEVWYFHPLGARCLAARPRTKLVVWFHTMPLFVTGKELVVSQRHSQSQRKAANPVVTP